MPRRPAVPRPSSGSVDPSTAWMLIRAAQRASEALERALVPLGLRPRHYRVLVALAEVGPRSQQALGELLGIDRTTMVAIIDELERQGLAERQPDAGDRRSYRVQLSARGRTTLVRATSAVTRSEEALVAKLEPAERQQLRASLSMLLDGEDAAGPAR